jgi:NADPH2:quinone reductase
MRAVQIDEFGGPEVMQVVDVPEPEPADGQVLIKVSRAGMNFADTHQRENSYLARYETPLILGGEVAGETSDGRRVVALVPSGGYAEYAVAHEAAVYPIPDGLDEGAALALLIQGLTAWHLYRTCARVAEGESVVVVSGAGGVGSLAVQLGKPFGAGRVIATASTPEKRELALSLGADVAVDPAVDDLTTALCAANGGKPVDVVLEMTGGRVTGQSIAALAPFGRLAFYGMASLREPDRVSPRELQRGSATVSGFWLTHALDRPADLRAAYTELAGRVAAGDLRVVHGGDHPMSDVRQAHDALRGRRSTGKLVLDPSR